MDERFCEIRVSPVIRFIVTRYVSEPLASGRTRAGCSTVGEFDNERMAEEVAMALRETDRQGLRPPE